MRTPYVICLITVVTALPILAAAASLQVGSRGAAVVEVQQTLIRLGYLAAGNSSGYFGPLTQAAVQAFQRERGIVSSGSPASTGYGAVGPRTKRALASGSSASTQSSSSQTALPADTWSQTLRRGASGSEVRMLQQYLISRGFLAAGNDTGYYGPLTEQAVRASQAVQGGTSYGSLTADGAIGIRYQTMDPITYYQTPNITTATASQCSGSVPARPSSSCATSWQAVYDSTGCQTGWSCPAPQTSASCSFDGRTLQSGTSVIAYEKATVSANASCVSQSRTCTNGTLSGSYAYSSCTQLASVPPPICTFSGQQLQSGASVTAYLAPSVAYGSSCASQIRTCSNGTLSGSYAFSSCTVQAANTAPASCTPLPAQTQTLSCPSGQTGSITQRRTSSCGAGSTPIWSGWTTISNTCTAIVSSSCTPLPAQTQTLSCPSGQTGAITQQRTSTCATGATSPTWSSWTNVSNTCTTVAPSGSASVPSATIKNLLIFQVGGWTGIIRDIPGGDFEWPANGGKSAYIARSAASLDHQMGLIKGLGDSVAVAVLLMDNSDASASGYGACWNGSWNEEIAGCTTGTFTRPFAMYDHFRDAAKRAGVRYAPDFSIMNYAHQGQGEYVLPALQSAISWWRTRLPDANAAKAPDGRYYVVVDGLPELAGLTSAQKAAILAYMRSQNDIFWIDNLVNDDGNASSYGGNVVRSAAAPDSNQSSLKSTFGSNYRWWFTANTPVRTFANFNSTAYKTPEATREKWLNINAASATPYPVSISQWNEYAEYLIFEPSTRSGTANYDYLKWMLSRQI